MLVLFTFAFALYRSSHVKGPATGHQVSLAVLPLQKRKCREEPRLPRLRAWRGGGPCDRSEFHPSLSIRPFAATTKYASPDIDLQKAARELHVADLVTGHFLVAGENVEVTLEAVDATDDSVLWRVTLRGTTRGLPAECRVRARPARIDSRTGIEHRPQCFLEHIHNAEAYELYLRAMSDDYSMKSQGSSLDPEIMASIKLLQRAVALDPGYASAWAALGHLYYYESGLFGGGESARLRAKAALERAVALDPSRIEAASDVINMESEEGDLNRVFDDITHLLHQRPDGGSPSGARLRAVVRGSTGRSS